MPITLSDGLDYDLSFERCAERGFVRRLPLPIDATRPDVQRAIDVVVMDGCELPSRFTGKTVAEWRASLRNTNDQSIWSSWYSSQARRVRDELAKALRRPGPPPMLDLGAPVWTSALVDRIRRRGPARATVFDWVKFILASVEHGVTQDEIKHSGVAHRLLGRHSEDQVLTRKQVLSAVLLTAPAPRLQLLVDDAYRPSNQWVECAELIKPNQHHKRGVLGKAPASRYVLRYRHRSIGWGVALVRHSDLLQSERKWWLVLDAKGARAIDQPRYGFRSAPEAMTHASTLMQTKLFKSARAKHTPRWERFSLDGLGPYAELMVTLPEWDTSFYSRVHYPGVRNLLLHLRTNVCDAEGGRQVLFIDEAQSDWHMAIAQQRRSESVDSPAPVPEAPFARDWPLVALKFALWWARRHNLSGVAWSTPELHLDRWRGHDPPTEVYRRGLPAAAERLARVLQIEFSRVGLRQRRVRPVDEDRTAWRVLTAKGHPTCKPFSTREQADRYADSVNAVSWPRVPVLWLDPNTSMARMPLFGVADPSLWCDDKKWVGVARDLTPGIDVRQA